MKIKEILPRQKRRHAHDTVEESLRFVDVPARSRQVKVTSHSKNKNKPSFTSSIPDCDCKLGLLFTYHNLDIRSEIPIRAVPLTVY